MIIEWIILQFTCTYIYRQTTSCENKWLAVVDSLTRESAPGEVLLIF